MIRLRLVLAFAATLAAGTALAADYYVAPNGSVNGNGSIGSPWDLRTVLNGGSVQPGDTVWMRGGTYTGTFLSYLRGTAANPIILRQYPGEQATIDGGNSNGSPIFVVTGAYTWYWGFEIFSSYGHRKSAQNGPQPTDILFGECVTIQESSNTGDGLKFINMVLHDCRQGLSLWQEATNAEASGNLIYNIGWDGSSDRGHGHTIYAQSLAPSALTIRDNVSLFGFEELGQFYGSTSAHIDNITLDGNTWVRGGALSAFGLARNFLLGGDIQTNNGTATNNYGYYRSTESPDTAAMFGYNSGCTNLSVSNNYVANNFALGGGCMPTTMTGNTIYGDTSGFSQSQYPDNTYLSSRPTGVQVFVRPNQYESGRANITVFNWPNQSAVDVDLSSVLSTGTSFVIRNAEDFFAAPVATGIYNGGTVSIPMTGLTVATPVGWTAASSSGPEFNAFILIGSPGPYEFLDVLPSNPFHDAISTIARNGITAGCGSGEFCPNAQVLRNQMAVFLLKAEHGSVYAPPAATGTVFNDVPATAFAADWIEAVDGEGISTGCGGGNYCPASPVTRSQMAVFLLKTLLGSGYVPPPPTGTVFHDVAAGSFAAAWIEDLAGRGLTSGCGAGNYCPASTVSRGQMAAFVVKTFVLQ